MSLLRESAPWLWTDFVILKYIPIGDEHTSQPLDGCHISGILVDRSNVSE